LKSNKELPVVAIVGASGSGKTTVLEKLIPELVRLGLRVGTIKHDVHGFEMDRPGKDSWRHKKAGSTVTVLSSPKQIGMLRDTDQDSPLEELIPLLEGVDLVLTEGYKKGSRPKMEVFRPELQAEPLCKGDSLLIALISDAEIDLGVPRFSPRDIESVANFVINYLHIIPSGSTAKRKAV
jgi:molybdopterin-guanine dinucleotide biosynthesis protein B